MVLGLFGFWFLVFFVRERPAPPESGCPLEQAGDLAGLDVHVHPPEGRVGAGAGHQGNGAAHRADELGAAIHQEVPDGQPPALGDPFLLAKIILNSPPLLCSDSPSTIRAHYKEASTFSLIARSCVSAWRILSSCRSSSPTRTVVAWALLCFCPRARSKAWRMAWVVSSTLASQV